MKSGTLPDAKTTTKSDETDESDTQTLSPGTAHSMTPEKDEIATTVSTSLESRISTLKRTTGNSGMSAVSYQELPIILCSVVLKNIHHAYY